MSDIYNQHSAAFRDVSAFIVLDRSGERVATIALKFPRDGAGRLYAYVHWLGVPMVRGFASGGGYDKRSAAIASAARKIPAACRAANEPQEDWKAFVERACRDDGHSWESNLMGAGFRVLQAV